MNKSKIAHMPDKSGMPLCKTQFYDHILNPKEHPKFPNWCNECVNIHINQKIRLLPEESKVTEAH